MNCKTSRIEIEERGDQNLSAAALKHLNGCVECSVFNRETERMQQLLQNLEAVSAPADFNFRVKARVRGATDTAVNPAWRKLIWIAPTVLAAILCGFVIIKNSSDADPLQAHVNPTAAQTAALATPTPAAETIDNRRKESDFVTANSETTKPAAPVIIARNNEPKTLANRRSEKNAAAARAKRETIDENEVINSRITSLRSERVAILPPGIPNPLAASQKLDAKQLLLTMGIKTENAANGLRVISISSQAANFALQPDDLIEKVNNENPLSVTGNSFQELNLTVRRQQTVKQIKISAKP